MPNREVCFGFRQSGSRVGAVRAPNKAVRRVSTAVVVMRKAVLRA